MSVVVADALLHMALALLRHTVAVADIVHQIVIVPPPEIGAHHIKAQWIELAEVTSITIKYIDVGQTVSVRPHLPKRRILHLAQIPRL